MRIAPIRWQDLVIVFEKNGWTFKRMGKGDRMVYDKPGSKRPLIIQKRAKPIEVPIIQGLIRTSGKTREEFLHHLK